MTSLPDQRDRPVIGVVLVNWNGCDDTLAALESLLAADPGPARVVVVDNGSEDDSVARLAAWGTDRGVDTVVRDGEPDVAQTEAWLTIVRAGANLGFAGGNNLGLRHLRRCDVTHFLLLNNDATVASDYFAHLADALAAFPSAGLIGSLIFHHPDRDRVWYSGGYEVPWRALVLHNYDVPATRQPYRTEFVTGCAMLIARPLYEELGELPQCYDPVYWEDGEYSRRTRLAGWDLVVAPAARVYHKVRTTGGGGSVLTPRVAFLEIRNRTIYVRRNYRGADRAMALTYLAITKPARALAEVLRGRPLVGSAIIRGYVRGLLTRTT